MATFQKKLQISLYSGAQYLIVEMLKQKAGKIAHKDLVATSGFFLISLLSMGTPITPLKAKFSFYGALIYYLISSEPFSKLIGTKNIGVKTAIYVATLVAVMYFPENSRL